MPKTRATEAHQSAVERQSEGLALWEASRSVREALKRSKEDNADDALSFLGNRLRDLMAEVKPLAADLGGVVSADGAIAKGGKALDAWRSLTDLLGVLRDIRDAQWRILHPLSITEGGSTEDGPRWRRLKESGHGEVLGLKPDDVPDWILEAMRTGSYSVPYLAWLANIGTAYVPLSLDEVEGEAVVAEEVGIADGPVKDFSPIVTPIPTPTPAAVYPHSRAAHVDYAQLYAPAHEAHRYTGRPEAAGLPLTREESHGTHPRAAARRSAF